MNLLLTIYNLDSYFSYLIRFAKSFNSIFNNMISRCPIPSILVGLCFLSFILYVLRRAFFGAP